MTRSKSTDLEWSRHTSKVLPATSGKTDVVAPRAAGLPAESQRLLRLLTMHPGHDFDAPAAAAMANLTITSAQHHLDTLLSAHLLEPRGRKRYGMHDLVRAYANERARIEQPTSCRGKALTRLLDHYRHTATAAMEQISLENASPTARTDYAHTAEFASSEQARTWLVTEQTTLCAIESLSGPHKSQASDKNSGFLARSAQRHAVAAVHRRTSEKTTKLVL